MILDLSHIECVVFDYGFTLSSEHYFNVSHPEIPNWNETIQKVIFSRSEIVEPWMHGEISLPEIANILAHETGVSSKEVLYYLRLGCVDLGLNKYVYEFACWVRSTPLRSALVTINMDVFSDVIVPSHGLDGLFDVIVNSAEAGSCDKTILWPIAFESIGSHISYNNSLLIEDGEKHPAEFRNQGGVAYQYNNHQAFFHWLREVNFGGNGQPAIQADAKKLAPPNF